MNAVPFLTRVVLRNYKSIGHCNVALQPLIFLVGTNGAGKGNFMDALHLVRDALSGTLENALNERGGIAEVCRRSSGQPAHFGMRLEFRLPKNGRTGYFAFNVESVKDGGYEVQNEECSLGVRGKGPFYRVGRGVVQECSEPGFPAVVADRLALVAASGLKAFRPVFDAFVSTGFYNLNPTLMRSLQTPQEGRQLKPAGENIASVIGHLKRNAPAQLTAITEYLHAVVPTVQSFGRKVLGPMETLGFLQERAGAAHPSRFLASSMSDGTLRFLGVLTALFQGNAGFAPALVGIEEPETTLHPAASGALRDALIKASRHVQVIVTSHSPDLLDDAAMDERSLLAVVAEGGETSSTGSPPESCCASTRFPRIQTPLPLRRWLDRICLEGIRMICHPAAAISGSPGF